MAAVSEFDKIEPWSYDGIKFPCEKWNVKGGVREHVHEYWKTDGGDPELGGNKLYEIRVVANFQTRFRKYVDLYPNKLDLLIRTFEQGVTKKLVVPTRGTIDAYCVDWDIEGNPRAIRSGEKVNLTFREVRNGSPFSIIELTDPSPAGLAQASSALTIYANAMELKPNEQSLFDQATALVNSIVAISDTANMYGQLVAAKVGQVTVILDQIDRLPAMQSAAVQPAVEALHDLWNALVKIADDVQGKQKSMQKYVLPMTMSVQQVSQAIYGDATHAEDLMTLNSGNAIRDPYVIAAGTPLLYYPS